MSADPTFTLTCDNESGDLAEEVRMAAALTTMFNSWKRERRYQVKQKPSPWAFWGPWTSSNAKSTNPYGER